MTIKERVISAAWGQDTKDSVHDPRLDVYPLRAAAEAVTILEEQIRARFTPELNTGTAMDALVIVGEAIRALQAELSPAPVEPPPHSQGEKKDALARAVEGMMPFGYEVVERVDLKTGARTRYATDAQEVSRTSVVEGGSPSPITPEQEPT